MPHLIWVIRFSPQPDFQEFGARIGFAWDPFRNGRLRFARSWNYLMSFPLPYQFILLMTQASPFFQYTSQERLPSTTLGRAA